jgi:hypothetical protein
MSLGTVTKWRLSQKRSLSSRIGCTFRVSSPVAHNVIIAASSSAACFGISGNYLVCYLYSCSVTHITNTSVVAVGPFIL